MAGIMVLCTVFSIRPDAAGEIVGAGNEGLTFLWIPQLFAAMPAGRLFMILFFLALFFAALTSLISMIELATRVLADAGVRRSTALALVGAIGFLLGLPSALSQAVFQNQDFVWGVGLMVSGLFFAVAVLRYGVTRFRETLINTEDADIRIGRWWDWAIRFVVLEALALVVWWVWQVRAEPLFGRYGLGTVALQWGAALAAFLALNRRLAARAARPAEEVPAAGPVPASIP